MDHANQLHQFIQQTPTLTRALSLVQALDIPQAAIAAGAIRNTVWDYLTNRPVKFQRDIDVVFFDPQRPYQANVALQAQLTAQAPDLNWEVKNEVYMHQHNFTDAQAFDSVVTAIASFPEIPTAVGAYLDSQQTLQLIAPYGLDDLFNLVVRPTPLYRQDAAHLQIYEQRMQQKKWQTTWPELTIWHPTL